MINPTSNAGHKWVLTAMDYFIRWVEVVPLKEATKSAIMDFLEEIMTRFGALNNIISDNVRVFTSFRIAN